MIHVARRVLGALVVLAIVAGATLALSSRPRLSSDRRAVERNGLAVRGGLDARYKLVDALARDVAAAALRPSASGKGGTTSFASS